jgi:glutamine synthetase
MHGAADETAAARAARKLRLETMIDVRKVCDETEAIVPANLWPLATYTELLFLDQPHGGPTNARD